MEKLDHHSTLRAWVVAHPETARVFEAFHLDYCCGGDTELTNACAQQKVQVDVVAAQLASAIAQPTESSETNWSESPLSELCDHIEQTHHAYLRTELPRLDALIAKVTDVHGENHREMHDVKRVFAALRAELEPHMMKEEQILFPAIRALETSATPPQFPFGSISNPIRMMEHEHDVAGTALASLRSLTDGYRVPDDACQTYQAMIGGLQQLEDDLHRHIHKENNILFPRAQKA